MLIRMFASAAGHPGASEPSGERGVPGGVAPAGRHRSAGRRACAVRSACRRRLTGDARHGASHVVVQPIHLFPLHADRAGVEQLHVRGSVRPPSRRRRCLRAAARRRRPDLIADPPAALTLEVIRFSPASTTPSLARMPIHDPALEMASIAYLQAGRRARLQPRARGRRPGPRRETATRAGDLMSRRS